MSIGAISPTIDARTLIPVVMGIGLTAFTVNNASSMSKDDDRASHEPFFILAVQLIGFAIVGAALYIVGWSAENGGRLKNGDLKAENIFIVALGALIVIVAIRGAWSGFVNSSPTSPWDRGLLDRVSTFMTFAMAMLIVVLFGMLLDLVLIRASTVRVSTVIPLITGLVIVVLAGASFLLRSLGGKDPSPRVFAMSRRQQEHLLKYLNNAHGSWMQLFMRPVGELEPVRIFSVDVWSTDLGWYFRAEDAYALARYHSWSANHLRTPVAALHLQRVSVFAGDKPASMRGLRVTQTTRRLWWIDAWRSHRQEPPSVDDVNSSECKAGLIHVSHAQLEKAGLIVTIGSASTVPRDENGYLPQRSPSVTESTCAADLT